jgi:hypothetical protein
MRKTGICSGVKKRPEVLLQRLRGLTNLRVVPDESSGTGYRVEIGPFPGWRNAPTW